MSSILVLFVAILSTIATAAPRPEKGIFSSIQRTADDGSSLLSYDVAFALAPDTLTGVNSPEAVPQAVPEAIPEAVPNLTQPPAGGDPAIENSPGFVQASSDYTNIDQDSMWATPAFTVANGGSVQALDDTESRLQAKEAELKRSEDALLARANNIPMPDLTDKNSVFQGRTFADWVNELIQEDIQSGEKEAAYAITDSQEKKCCHDVTSTSVAGNYLAQATSVRQSQYTAWQTRLGLYSNRLNERSHMLDLKKRAKTGVLGDFLTAWQTSASHRTEDLIIRDRVAPEANLACCRFIDSMKTNGRP